METNFISRFIKGIAATSVGMGCQIALGLMGFIITARLVSPTQLGAFVVIQVISMFFMMISGLALEGIAVTRYIAAADVKDRMRIVSSAICFKLGITLALSILIISGKPIICYFIKEEGLYHLFKFIPVIYSLISIDDVLLKSLQGLHQYRKIATAQIINAVSKFVFTLLFLIVFKMDVVGVVYAMTIALSLSIVYQISGLPAKKNICIDLRLIKGMMSFGFPLGLNSVLTFVFNYLDNLMIAVMLNPASVAYYSVAAKIPENLRKMYESYYSVYFPNMTELLSQKKYDKAAKVLEVSMRYISLMIASATIMTVLFQREIVQLLFSDKYLPSALALTVLMLVLCINIIGHMLGTTLVAYGRSDTPIKINIITSLVNFGSNLLLIPKFGFMGAVYATLIANSVVNPVVIFYVNKIGLRVKMSNYLKPFFLLLLCWGLYWLVDVKTMLIKILVIMVFAIGCAVLSLVPKDDVENILRVMKKMIAIQSEAKMK